MGRTVVVFGFCEVFGAIWRPAKAAPYQLPMRNLLVLGVGASLAITSLTMAAGAGELSVILGPPTVFDKSNIDQFNF